MTRVSDLTKGKKYLVKYSGKITFIKWESHYAWVRIDPEPQPQARYRRVPHIVEVLTKETNPEYFL